MRYALALLLLASPALAQSSAVNNGDGTATFSITAPLAAFTDLCVARGYLGGTCTQADLDGPKCSQADIDASRCSVLGEPLVCSTLGETLATTTCSAGLVSAGICRADLEGQTIPPFVRCAAFLGARAVAQMRAEILGGREILIDRAKPAVDTTDPFGVGAKAPVEVERIELASARRPPGE